MNRRVAIWLAAALVISAGGCATAINLQEATKQKPYGGFTMPLDDFFGGAEAGDYVLLRFWPLWLLDKPLCLFGDTVTLPYTLWLQRAAWLPSTSPTAAPDQAPQPAGAAVPVSAQ
jgi:uncharacterized protein YceK